MNRKVAAAILLLVAAALAWQVTPLRDVSAEDLVAAIQSFAGQRWAVPATIGLYVVAQLVLFPLPVISLAAVIAFGPWLGFACAMAGVLLAALAGYGAGRLLKRTTVRGVAGARLARLTRALRRRGLAAITTVRLVPVAPFLVESIVAGALRIKLWHFALGTLVGALPGTLAAAFVGDQIAARLRGTAAINVLLLVGAVVAIVVVTWLACRWLVRSRERRANHGKPRARALRTRARERPLQMPLTGHDRSH